eukprot:scaffold140672_cov76-Cyclotella_meneghiniana.AAC.5
MTNGPLGGGSGSRPPPPWDFHQQNRQWQWRGTTNDHLWCLGQPSTCRLTSAKGAREIEDRSTTGEFTAINHITSIDEIREQTTTTTLLHQAILFTAYTTSSPTKY